MATEPAYMEILRGLVKGDGFDFEYLGIDPMQGALRLRLFATAAKCGSCVTSKEWWEELALTAVRKSSPAVRKVVIIDER